MQITAYNDKYKIKSGVFFKVFSDAKITANNTEIS